MQYLCRYRLVVIFFELDEDGTSTINHSIIQGGWTGTANLDADPKFVTPIEPASAPTTAGDFHLRNIKKINYPAGLLYAHKYYVTNCRLTLRASRRE